jgi:hypothetical protein
MRVVPLAMGMSACQQEVPLQNLRAAKLLQA